MGRHSVWELVFFMVILKIPIVYLGMVVWYAIKSEPTPEEGAAVTVRVGSDDRGPSSGRPPRRFLPRPHGGPSRTYVRAPRTTVAHSRSEQDSLR
jgi:hypothetical protein